MSQLIEILHNDWDKTEFTVWIGQPKPTDRISSSDYVALARKAIGIWETILHNHVNISAEHEHLRKIKFTIVENCTNNEDIVIRWWFSNQYNGQTDFERNDSGMIKKAYVSVAKYNGPNIGSAEDAEPLRDKATFIIRNSEQIESVLLHEFGHVFGLGHCSYWKDLMKTGDVSQPNPARRISSIDMRIISSLFGSIGKAGRKNLIKTQSFSEDEWKSLH